MHEAANAIVSYSDEVFKPYGLRSTFDVQHQSRKGCFSVDWAHYSIVIGAYDTSERPKKSKAAMFRFRVTFDALKHRSGNNIPDRTTTEKSACLQEYGVPQHVGFETISYLNMRICDQYSRRIKSVEFFVAVTEIIIPLFLFLVTAVLSGKSSNHLRLQFFIRVETFVGTFLDRPLRNLT